MASSWSRSASPARDLAISSTGSLVAARYLSFLLYALVDLNELFRVQKLKNQFAHLYIVVTLPTKEQNDSFVCSYFKPIFVPVQNLEMGFEKIVKIALARGVCKQQDAISKLKFERQRAVEGMDAFRQVLTSIPSIDNHDANALNQAIGSIEAISRATKDQILEKTDLSAEKAEIITRFFRDPKYYLSPKII
ncbi:hypothetical protein Syun_030348 [Stephania yunnanensis]|uniref:DisA/LigA helix-hairpin-helix motif domain-containing protein n=1 Tax=Stephania yunnanensis TaxID=152371 RepID=A0AAP0EFM7_9MAGN